MVPDPHTLAVLALVAAGAALLSLGLCLSLVRTVHRLRAAYDALVAGDPATSFVEALRRQAAGADGLRGEVRNLREELAATRRDLTDALRHVAVVRYDAFGDMGGRMSFSAALLDDAGDGLVLTSINGRSETRTYAKGVTGRLSEHALSPEEEQAVLRASAAGSGPGAAPAARRRR